MIDRVGHPRGGEDVEAALRQELARGDAMAETVLPILRHLVAAEDDSVFSADCAGCWPSLRMACWVP